MKKFLVLGLIAGAGVMMASCSKDASNSDFSQNAIEFGTYLGRDAQTKGAITDTDTLKKGFGITAFYTGKASWAEYGKNHAPNFMYNQQVTYTDGTNWSYSPVKYWPTMDNEKISFFAYAPYNAAGITLPAANANTNVTTLTFEVQSAEKMVDFVTAQVIDAEQANQAAGGADPILFNLKHELSRIAFEAKTSMPINEKSHVILRSTKLKAGKSFYKKGTYTFADASTSDATNPRGEWIVKNEDQADFDISGILKFGDKSYGAKANKKNYDKAIELNSNPTSIFGTDMYLFLIPATTEKGTAIVEFTYDIVTETTGKKIDLEDYVGQMGTGLIDAYKLLMQVEGTPCVTVTAGKEEKITLTNIFGGSAKNLTYTGVSMSAEDMKKLGIGKMPEMINGQLVFTCLNPGTARITVKAIGGGTNIGSSTATGGSASVEAAFLEVVLIISDGFLWQMRSRLIIMHGEHNVPHA